MNENEAKTLICIVLCMTVFSVNYLTMPKFLYRGDPISIRLATVSLINNKTIEVPEEVARNFGDKGQYFYLNGNTGKWYSIKGVMNTLMYVPPLWVEKIYVGTLDYEPRGAVPHIRVFVQNIYFIILSMIAAVLIYKISLFYTSRSLTAAIYTLSVLYGTFYWYYMRGQTYEIFQMIFFLGFFYYLKRFSMDNRLFNLLLSTISLSALIMTKLVYAGLIPVVVLAIPMIKSVDGNEAIKCYIMDVRNNWHRYLFAVGLPLSIVLLCQAILNDLKFGSLTGTGYDQWHKYESINIFGGDPVIASKGFLFSIQQGIFINFPILIIALFGVRIYYRKHSGDALLIISIFILYFILYIHFVDWKGELCYGPRYLLFVLPLLSLPAINVVDGILDRRKNLTTCLYASVIIFIMVYSSIFQQRVNSLDFFSYYYIKSVFDRNGYGEDRRIKRYFSSSHYGSINKGAYNSVSLQGAFYPLSIVREIDEIGYKKVIYDLKHAVRPNYYWQ